MTDFLSANEWSQTAGELAADGWLLADLCGLDRTGLGEWDARFAIVVQLLHHERRERQTIHVDCGGDPPTVASCVEFWPTANFMEREAYDLFGIVFDGHPDLTRILLPDAWEGHPLRKDYGVGKVAIEFARQPVLQIDLPGQSPTGAEADVAVDRLGQAGPPERELAPTEEAP